MYKIILICNVNGDTVSEHQIQILTSLMVAIHMEDLSHIHKVAEVDTVAILGTKVQVITHHLQLVGIQQVKTQGQDIVHLLLTPHIQAIVSQVKLLLSVRQCFSTEVPIVSEGLVLNILQKSD